jgi:nitrogenase molybdenum-iron protein alpha/beta subunit
MTGVKDAGKLRTELARSGDRVRMFVSGKGFDPLTIVIARDDGGECFARTAHLAVRYEGSTLTAAQGEVLRLVAGSLGGVRFDDLARRVPEETAPPPTGTGGREPIEDKTHDVQTVDEWGNPDRWRTFIFRREFQRNASSAIRLTGARVITVSHGESECQYATPSIDGRTMSLYNYPWVRPPEGDAVPPDGGAPPRVPGYITTDLRDADIITGGTARLTAVLKTLERQVGGNDVVVVKSTCVPHVIGDDMEGAVRAWRGRGRIRYDDVMAAAGTDLAAELMAEAIASRNPRRRPRPAVNIAGIPRGAAFDEVSGILGEAGVAINCAMIPEVDLREAVRWCDAGVQVLVPNPYHLPLYEKVLMKLLLRTLSPAAPFGIAATERWLLEVAGACARGAAIRKVLRRHKKRLEPRLARMRADAAGSRLGFVIAPEDYPALCDPMAMGGVPVLDLVVEAGFGVDLMVHQRAGDAAGIEINSAHASSVTVHGFADERSLRVLMDALPCAAIYSDLYCDERVTRAGKTPFSLQFFEPGFEGAIRTAGRLLGACGAGFYRKFARESSCR